MYFEIVSEISEIQTVAVGSKIYEIERLRKQFGHGRWRKLKGIALIKLPSGRIRRVELHLVRSAWHRQTKNEDQALSGSAMTKTRQATFVVCVANRECEDLEVRKIYQVLPDDAAAMDGLVRIVDESGEDYLYPSELFVEIELPQAVEKALIPAA